MATYIDLRRMLANDARLTSVFLTFSSRLNTPEFRKAIKSNNVIEEVVISADELFFEECSPEEQFQDVFEAIGQLPKLKKLSINSYPNCRGIVSLKVINPMLSAATDLATLNISDVDVTGTPQEFQVFSERVQRMMYLRSFCFAGCNIMRESPDSSSRKDFLRNLSKNRRRLLHQQQPQEQEGLLDPLFLSLPLLPSLEVLYLEAKDRGGLGSLSVSAATALCLSASLRMLKLKKLLLTDSHVTSMALLLELSPSIQHLELGTLVNLSPAGAAALRKLLATNSTLSHVELSLHGMIRDDCAEELSLGLRLNRSITSFALTADGDCGNANNDKKNDKKKNAASSKGGNGVGRVSTICRKAFLQMLQYNYTLEKFLLFRKYPLSRELKMYAGFNRLGRGELLYSSANKAEQWVEKLAQINEDVNTVFYFLSNNPTLCMTAPTATKRKTVSNNDEDEDCQNPPRAKKQRLTATA